MKKVEDLEKELNNRIINTIYLLYGEEQYLIEQVVKKIKSVFGECIKGINYIQIDESNYMQIISDIETPSFGYEKKLIIAKNSGFFKKEGRKKSAELSQRKRELATYLERNIRNDKW